MNLSQKPSGAKAMRSASAFGAFPLLVCGILNCKASETDRMESSYSRPAETAYAAEKAGSLRPDAAYRVGYVGGCPAWMVRVGDPPQDFCIDRFEDHVAVVGKDGRRKPHAPSLHPRSGLNLVAEASPDSYPQSSINRPQAAEACQNAGKRLCTLREWMRACMGVGATTYPYGDAEEKGACNTGKPHILSELFGNDPMKWSRDDMNDPVINVIRGYLAKPGAYPSCVSSYGAYDMVGNLHEWVSDLVDQSIISSRVYVGKKKRGDHYPRAAVGNGIFMGGFFSSENQNGRGCNYETIAHPPSHYDYSTGFRCCKDTEGS